MTTVSTHQARENLAKLIELAFYKAEKIQVKRNNRPMAWIVGEPFMDAVGQVVDYLIENEPAIADTLAIMVDDKIRQTIEQGVKESRAGEYVPIETILDD